MSKTLKRGDPQNIECIIGKSRLVIKTQFVKKA